MRFLLYSPGFSLSWRSWQSPRIPPPSSVHPQALSDNPIRLNPARYRLHNLRHHRQGLCNIFLTFRRTTTHWVLVTVQAAWRNPAKTDPLVSRRFTRCFYDNKRVDYWKLNKSARTDANVQSLNFAVFAQWGKLVCLKPSGRRPRDLGTSWILVQYFHRSLPAIAVSPTNRILRNNKIKTRGIRVQ